MVTAISIDFARSTIYFQGIVSWGSSFTQSTGGSRSYKHPKDWYQHIVHLESVFCATDVAFGDVNSPSPATPCETTSYNHVPTGQRGSEEGKKQFCSSRPGHFPGMHRWNSDHSHCSRGFSRICPKTFSVLYIQTIHGMKGSNIVMILHRNCD